MSFGIPRRIRQLWNRHVAGSHQRQTGVTGMRQARLTSRRSSRKNWSLGSTLHLALEGLEDRRTMDAAQDLTFGNNGVVTTTFDGSTTRMEVVGGVLLPSNELAVVGTADQNSGVSQVAVAEFLENGDPRSAFDQDGRLRDSLNATDVVAGGIQVQAGGKLIVAGATADGQTLSVIRLNTDGSRDLTFGAADGTVDGRSALTAPANTQLVPVDVSVHPTTGAITIPIRVRNVTTNSFDFGFARWDASGTLQTTLGTNGLVQLDLGDIEDFVYSSATGSDGSTVIVGEAQRHAVAVRYLANGSLDTNFGTLGIARFNYGGDVDSIHDVILDSQNRIVVVGYAVQSGLPQFAAARLTSTGQLDASFGSGGRVVVAFDSFGQATSAIAESVVELPDGRLIVAGTVTGDEVGSTLPSDFGIAVLTQNGQSDTSFETTGHAVIDLGIEDRVADLIQQSGGKIVIVGDSDGELAMTRLVFEITNPYDLNLDGFVDSLDIDRLYLAIRNGESNSRFDLNDDAIIDQTDVDFLVGTVFNTVYGDVNLDGIFNSTDLVLVFQAGEYEDVPINNSEWSTGDWDGNGDFTSSDFVFVFQRGGYSAAALPELNRKPLFSFID